MRLSRAHRRCAAAAVVVIGVPSGAAALVAARTAALSDELAAAAGVPAQIGSVDVDLTGTVRLSDVAIGDMFSAPTVEASVALESLLAGELGADEIRVGSPHLALAIDADGDSDLGRVVRRLARPGAGRGDGPSRIRRVLVAEGTLAAHIDGVGDVEADRVQLVPDTGGVRMISGDVHVHAATGRAAGELVLARAAAEITLPRVRFGRILAVSGHGQVAIDSKPSLALHDVAIGRLAAGGPIEVEARVDDNGTARRVSVAFTPGSGTLTAHGDRIPLAGIAALVPRALDLSTAHASGALAIRRDGSDWRVDLAGGFTDVRVQHAAVAAKPIAVSATLRGVATLSHDAIALRDAVVDVGAAHYNASGWLHRGSPASAELDVGLQQGACDALLASVPGELRGPLDGMAMTGTFGGRGRLAIDLQAPLGEGVTLDLDLDNHCEVTAEPPNADVTQLAGVSDQAFADGSHAKVGKDQPGWVRVHDLPSYVIGAFTSAEDARFFDHHGFDVKQIAKSLEIDLRDGQISRGGSTISQQLIKNSFLSQRRSLDRKIQEAILTWRLEARMSKHAIIERYLNIIELGPHVYGLGAAARHWFDKPASELTIKQAAFLGGLTAEPTAMSRHVRRAGALDPESAARVDLVLHMMRADGVIDGDDLDRATAAPISFAPSALKRD